MDINHRIGSLKNRPQPLSEAHHRSTAETRQAVSKAVDKVEGVVDDARKVLNKALDKLEDAGKNILDDLPWMKTEQSEATELDDDMFVNNAGQVNGRGDAGRNRPTMKTNSTPTNPINLDTSNPVG